MSLGVCWRLFFSGRHFEGLSKQGRGLWHGGRGLYQAGARVIAERGEGYSREGPGLVCVCRIICNRYMRVNTHIYIYTYTSINSHNSPDNTSV